MQNIFEHIPSDKYEKDLASGVETIARAIEEAGVASHMRDMLAEILSPPSFRPSKMDDGGILFMSNGVLLGGFRGFDANDEMMNFETHRIRLGYPGAQKEGFTKEANLYLGIKKRKSERSQTLELAHQRKLLGGGSIHRSTQVWSGPSPKNTPKRLIHGIREIFSEEEAQALQKAIDETRAYIATKRNK